MLAMVQGSPCPLKDRGQVGLCKATGTMGMLTLAQGASCPSKAVGPHGTRTFSLPTTDRCPLRVGPSPAMPQPSVPAGTRTALPLQ